ncbi:TIGR03759 family integrating conjugative element protein [Vreelandella olivaria]|uniref:TIGR03759 family integrating conjugative element protein n=1 Tax=Vreelandella olivaria TaxID=390919 RepID=UPI00201E8ECA
MIETEFKRVSLTVGLALASMVTTGSVLAQTSSIQDLTVHESGVNDSLRAEAQEWGLEEQELDRYEQLMQGSRGIWSPGLDPVTALGIEAETEQDRRRYAELLVQIEKERVERELAFQRAYDEAWARLYPNDLPITPFLVNEGAGESIAFFGSIPTSSSSRLSVHVAAGGCTRCDETIDQLLASGTPMDVFVVDSDGDDNVIRTWARDRSIPVSRVQSREITLNHGQAQPSLGVTADNVPQVFAQ